MSIARLLVEFVASGQRNAWLDDGPTKAYVRQGVFPGKVPGVYLPCLWLANCQTSDVGQPGTGRLRPVFQMMDALLETGVFSVLCVENVMNPRLVEVLEKWGWEADGDCTFDADEMPITFCSYWKTEVVPRVPG